MKMITRVASVFALLAASAFAPASAREAVIVLSPIGTTDEKMVEIETVARHLIDTVSVGEEAFVIDGLTQEQVAHYALPNDPDRYRNPRNRMRDNAAVFRDLKHFAETAIAPTEDAFAGLIDFPTVLRTVNASYPAEGARDLIFYNVSPVTHDPREEALSMMGGVIPDDDHIAGSRADTVYGADGENAYLQNYAVHFGANGTDWQVSDRHGHFMAKYLWFSVTKRGGALATFATDPAAALRNAKAGIGERVGPFTPELDGHRTMVHFRPTAQAATDDIGETVNEASLSIYDRTLSQRAPDRLELRIAEDVELAIRWNCDCDFDLAVQVPGEDPISFRAPRGSSGTLFKDFTSSASLKTAWETISMPGPVDLQAVTVAVNQFSGGAGAEVELRVAIAGETWGKTLSIAGPADSGSGFARTMSQRESANQAWAVVDLANVMEVN